MFVPSLSWQNDRFHIYMAQKCRVLQGLEGDFWCKIRGLGLSYGYSISNGTESERLSFTLSRSTDPVEAHKAAKVSLSSPSVALL